MDEKCPKCGSTNVEEINYIIREDGEKDYDCGKGKCLDCGWEYMIAFI